MLPTRVYVAIPQVRLALYQHFSRSVTPEAAARENIDAQLVASGWIVPDCKKVDFSAGDSIAIREVPLKTGTGDYLLLVDHLLGAAWPSPIYATAFVA